MTAFVGFEHSRARECVEFPPGPSAPHHPRLLESRSSTRLSNGALYTAFGVADGYDLGTSVLPLSTDLGTLWLTLNIIYAPLLPIHTALRSLCSLLHEGKPKHHNIHFRTSPLPQTPPPHLEKWDRTRVHTAPVDECALACEVYGCGG